LAFDRALQLNPKNAAAINNKAVAMISAKGAAEDWIVASEALAMFQKALKLDEFLVAAKMNRGLLLNYYRLFEKSKPLFEQVLVRNALSDAQLGLAVSLQGMGDAAGAQSAFQKAFSQGASSSGFAALYHQASSAQNASPTACLSTLSDLKSESLEGFEREAVIRLKRACESKKGAKQ
jgi:tetratricopeptide (TPR) repeat protein